MKKLPAFLNTPARLVVAVALLILLAELLIMLVIENIRDGSLKNAFLGRMVFEFIDPVVLVIIVSPALLFLIFRPMRSQQVELERQLDELRRFQSLGIGRELRMKELAEEIAALRTPLSAEPAGDVPAQDSREAQRHAAAQPATTQPTEESQRSALLFMLEDLEAARKKIEQAHREWMAALDVVDDPIFLHDKQFRILRCNKAYQQCAGIPFDEIIGQPYYEIFPKSGSPLPCYLRAMEKAEEEEEEEEEVAVGGAIYRSRAFSVKDEQGVYLYSVHTLEDITESRQAEAAFRTLVGTAAANIGAAFFHKTVSSLSAWLGVECVIIGELVDENRVRALAMQLDGKAIEHYEYALPGTPCNKLASKGYCEYPEGVCQLFPSDKDLSDMGAEAYVGTPIRDENGKTIGVLCAISRHKLALPLMTQGVFEIIASRAGAEIKRKRTEDTLSESEERYRSLFENMLEGYAYCRMLFDHDAPLDFIYISVNDAFGKITGLTDVVGKKVSEVIPGIRESNPELFEIYGRIALTGQPEAFETYVDVLGIWFSITAYSPRKEHFVAVFNNITERKQAEIRLNEQVEELRRWHDVTLGREVRVLDLKHEVNELLSQTNQPLRYPSAESVDPQEK